MIEKISSRKLAAVFTAIVGIVGLVLGLAVIQPDILTDTTSVGIVGLAVVAISGLGGFVVHRQARIDELAPGVNFPFVLRETTDEEEDVLNDAVPNVQGGEQPLQV